MLNRREFIKAAAAVGAAVAIPFKFAWQKIHDVVFVRELRYYDRRLSDDELQAMSKGVFPDETE